MRRVVGISLTVVAAVLVVAAVGAIVVFTRAETSTAGKLRFAQPLRIPPLLDPRPDSDGRKLFDLRLQEGEAELLPGKATSTWGVNGPHLGPTLRASRGDRVTMRVHNTLPETTTLHWHGMHLPAHADGGPHQPISSGGRWSPEWTIDQPAATLWYHPHLMGATEDHAYRGVAGMWILDDPAAADLPLPQAYGADDIPLIIQDKRLDDDGELDFGQAAISPIGRLGEHVVVNGTSDPHLVVRDELIRFRLLNASTARVYAVGFADERRFDLVATDGGLLERPAPLSRVRLSPGERAEIVARFTPGERAILRSFPPELGTDFVTERFAGGDDTLDLLEVRAAGELRPSSPLPARLSSRAADERQDFARTRQFELSGSRRINGLTMSMARVDAAVQRGTTELWEVTNRGNTPHNFHVHGIQFRVLEYAGGRPPAALSGPKDTVYVPPGETVRLAAGFSHHADAHAPYMFHCHLLEHADNGMMGQYVVVEGSSR